MIIKIVENWKSAWKWISVHCMLLAASIQAAWEFIPEDMRQSIPSNLIAGFTIGLLVLGLLGRLIKQGNDNAGIS